MRVGLGMAVDQVLFEHDRKLLIRPLTPLNEVLPAGFIALIPAFGENERTDGEELMASLLELGCLHVCCLGPESETLHDSIDWVIEAANQLDVVTTWHDDVVEGCEYFVHVASGRAQVLVAFVAERPEVVDTLMNEVRAK